MNTDNKTAGALMKSRLPYPEHTKRVTAGRGGEAILIFGTDKTALLDTGMAWCHEPLIQNIEKALGAHRTLDYVLISHTHYDHIGALPYVLRRWPQTIVCGAEKAKEVFSREGAVAMICRLSMVAAEQYGRSGETLDFSGMRIDRILREGDRIDLGERCVRTLETKGHTDCSLSYVLEPDSVLFASESTGVFRGDGAAVQSILKSYSDSISAAIKCRAEHCRIVVSPHYGVLPENYRECYWDMFLKQAECEKAKVLRVLQNGGSEEDALAEYTDVFWSEERQREQPKAAFDLNARIFVRLVKKEFYQDGQSSERKQDFPRFA